LKDWLILLNMVKLKQGIRTRFGRDISIPLRDRILDEIRKYDTIRGVWIKSEKEEIHNGKREKIYYFNSIGYNLHGRIFPLDELISPKRKCDIIVQNWKDGSNLNLDAQIYHDLYIGEELKVQISRKDKGLDPSFKIFNHIGGFVKDSRNGLYENIHVGTKILVDIYKVWIKNKKIHVFTYPLKIL